MYAHRYTDTLYRWSPMYAHEHTDTLYRWSVTLRVDSDGECEHDPLGQERRVTLVSWVQGKPHLHNT